MIVVLIPALITGGLGWHNAPEFSLWERLGFAAFVAVLWPAVLGYELWYRAQKRVAAGGE